MKLFNSKNLYCTFHPDDRARVVAIIQAWRGRSPELNFLGRIPHAGQSSGEQIARAADMESSNVTVVFESDQTPLSSEVREDIVASLAKSPPNRIVRVQLDQEIHSGSSDFSSMLDSAGAVELSSAQEELDLLISRERAAYSLQRVLPEVDPNNPGPIDCDRTSDSATRPT